jgi:hypothetical protein
MATTKDILKYSSYSFDELINLIADLESNVEDKENEINNLKDELEEK